MWPVESVEWYVQECTCVCCMPVHRLGLNTAWKMSHSQGNLSLYLFRFSILAFFAYLMSAMHGTCDSSCKSCISTHHPHLITLLHKAEHDSAQSTLNCCSNPEHLVCGSSFCMSAMTVLSLWATTAVSPQHRYSLRASWMKAYCS